MSRKIIGVTVGTPTSPSTVKEKLKLATEDWVLKGFQPSLVEDTRGEVITVSDASDLPLAGLKVFGKTVQNGTPTPDTPVPLESVGDVNVTVCGKNLLKNNWTTDDLFSGGSVQYRYLDDGRFTLNGTASATSVVPFMPTTPVYNETTISNGKALYTVKAGQTFYLNGVQLICRKVSDGSAKFIQNGLGEASASSQAAYTATEDLEIIQIRKLLPSGTTYTENVVWEPTFSFEKMDVYEPYKDGGSLTLSTPNGLPGIPVESGGNYTDPATGKQWICDEVDFEKGVYVQNVYKEKLTEAYAAWDTSIACEISKVPYYGAGTGNPQLCSHMPVITYGQLGSVTGIAMYSVNGAGYCAISKKDFSTVAECQEWLDANEVYVVYRLLNPIYHNLSEIDPDALAQYAALHSNYPNTTVFNDKNVGMEVKYVADTKLYIDKKFTELAAAIVNN